MKKLYRSQYDRKLCGVCGGIANYFDIDSTIIRLIWVLISPAFIIYIICALLIPVDHNEIYVANRRKIFKSYPRVIAGVCGGFAEYLHVDPVVIRIIWAASIFVFGTGLWAYIVMAIVMPEGYV